MLDEECVLPKGTYQNVLDKLNDIHGNSPFWPKVQKPQIPSFVVRHYAADVCYDITAFLVKNKDILYDGLEDRMRGSSKAFVRALFLDFEPNKKGPSKSTVATQFRTQLVDLLSVVEVTEAHYVRCISPNKKKSPNEFDAPYIMHQLRCCGLIQLIQLRKMGYSYRSSYEQFIEKYTMLITENMWKTDAKTTTSEFLNKTLSPNMRYACGKNKIFLQREAFEKLEDMKSEIISKYATVFQTLIRSMIARRYYYVVQEMEKDRKEKKKKKKKRDKKIKKKKKDLKLFKIIKRGRREMGRASWRKRVKIAGGGV